MTTIRERCIITTLPVLKNKQNPKINNHMNHYYLYSCTNITWVRWNISQFRSTEIIFFVTNKYFVDSEIKATYTLLY